MNDRIVQKWPGQAPHHWVKICPICGGINLRWYWDGEKEDRHPNQNFCTDCKEWVTPSKKRVFL